MKNLRTFLSGSLVVISLLSLVIVLNLALQTGNSFTSFLAAVGGFQRISASCYPSSEYSLPGESVRWVAEASGGDHMYTYIWSGTDNLWSKQPYAEHIYQSEGLKTATVTIVSGDTSKTIQCEPLRVQYEKLRGACNVLIVASKDDIKATWNIKATGGSGKYSYVWSGTDNLWGNSHSITHSYTAGGEKAARVTVISGNQDMTLTCSATIPHIRNLQSEPISFGCVDNSQNYVTHEPFYWQTLGAPDRIRWSGTHSLRSDTYTASITYSSRGIKTASIVGEIFDTDIHTSCQTQIADQSEVFKGIVIRPNPYGLLRSDTITTYRDHRPLSPTNERPAYETQQPTSQNTQGNSSETSSPKSKSGCFIATAAYGTDMEPQVETLRNFRDDVLLQSKVGEIIVDTYYAVSPPVARLIEKSELAKMTTRSILEPIVTTTQLIEKFRK